MAVLGPLPGFTKEQDLKFSALMRGLKVDAPKTKVLIAALSANEKALFASYGPKYLERQRIEAIKAVTAEHAAAAAPIKARVKVLGKEIEEHQQKDRQLLAQYNESKSNIKELNKKIAKAEQNIDRLTDQLTKGVVVAAKAPGKR